MLGLVFGVSVLFYIADTSINTSSKSQSIPSISTPSVIPTAAFSSTLTPTSSSPKLLSETIHYSVRNFSESITVNLTLMGTTITDLQVMQSASNEESASYQDAFAAEIKSYVVGKNIKDLNVSKVAGASYTTEGFMQAVKNIRTKI